MRCEAVRNLLADLFGIRTVAICSGSAVRAEPDKQDNGPGYHGRTIYKHDRQKNERHFIAIRNDLGRCDSSYAGNMIPHKLPSASTRVVQPPDTDRSEGSSMIKA